MDAFFDVYESEVCLPGLEETVTLFHISDSHLCIVDDLTPEGEADHLRKREDTWMDARFSFLRFFGESCSEERRVHTWEAFDRLTALAAERGADMLLSTGDLMEHMHGAGARFLKERMAALPFPLLATPGNHEDASCEGLWTEGVQVVEYPGFRIVAVDDRLRTVTDGALDTLAALLRGTTPVILMMHVPLLTDGNRASVLGRMDPYFCIDERTCDGNASRFLELLRESECVKLILCGHVHGWTDTCPIAGIRQITAPQGMAGGAHVLTIHG